MRRVDWSRRLIFAGIGIAGWSLISLATGIPDADAAVKFVGLFAGLTIALTGTVFRRAAWRRIMSGKR